MGKQPVRKKKKVDGTSVDRFEFMNNYREKNDLTGVSDKPLEWFVLPKGFHDALKIPGIPKGYVSMVRGFPNTGKSTIKLNLIAECQRMGVLPVIYETESNFAWDHARACGVEFEEVWGDVEVDDIDQETGEVIGTKIVKEVVDYKGFFLFFDNDILFKQYGKMDYAKGVEAAKPTRDIAVLEDVAYSIEDLLTQQRNGDLPYEMCFIWDSVGSLPSFRSTVSKVSNNMWDAGAIAASFATIANNRIPSSRKSDKEYTNTLFLVNKIWIDGTGMGGPVVKHKGGESLAYMSRLVIHLGGILSHGVTRLKATSKGETYYYGIEVRANVYKNHVNDVSYEGKLCSLPHGLWSSDDLNEYKKTHMKFILDKMSEVSGKVIDGDIAFETEESEVNVLGGKEE